MSSTAVDHDSLRRLVADAILGSDFCRATFGGTVRGKVSTPWVRVAVRPIELHGQRHLQFSYFDVKKSFTKNFRASESGAPLDEVLNMGFAAIHLSTRSEEVDLRTTKKGKVLVGRRQVEAAASAPPLAHNRSKDVPLPEGQADRLLEALGILTRDGRVRPIQRAKYTQINEFLKQLSHTLDGARLRSLERPVQILDCGCGASYLTLAVHYYLNDVLDIPAQILGVDVNDEVIRKSIARAEGLEAGHVQFTCRPIAAAEGKPDIVLALHACDTATDDAIAQAIVSEAKILLSVPCCHHHLNELLRPVGPAAVLRPLLRHGLLQQRAADLVTDAFRALILRIAGYRTEVVEFISVEHTARNLMIRAVRGAPRGDASLINEYLEMCRFWGVTPYLASVLGAPFQRLLTDASSLL